MERHGGEGWNYIIISNGKSVGWTSVPACSSLGPLSYDKAGPLPQFTITVDYGIVGLTSDLSHLNMDSLRNFLYGIKNILNVLG